MIAPDNLPDQSCPILLSQRADLLAQQTVVQKGLSNANTKLIFAANDIYSTDLGNVPVPLTGASASYRLALLSLALPYNGAAVIAYGAYVAICVAIGGLQLQLASLAQQVDSVNAQITAKGC